MKGCQYLGQQDEFVASGSDCGSLFIWERNTGKLAMLLEVRACDCFADLNGSRERVCGC